MLRGRVDVSSQGDGDAGDGASSDGGTGGCAPRQGEVEGSLDVLFSSHVHFYRGKTN